MIFHNFVTCTHDRWCYFKICDNRSFLYLLLYVKGLLIVVMGNEENLKVRTKLNREFKMKDLRAAKKILRIRILIDKLAEKLYLNQKGYIEKVLNKFNIQHAKLVSTPLAAHFRFRPSYLHN